MSDKKPDSAELLKLITTVLIFAVVTLPILHLTGIHDLLVKLSVESAKVLMRLFGHPST